MSEPVSPPPIAESASGSGDGRADLSCPRSPLLLPRLSAMMFLQFLPPGLWVVTISSYVGANTAPQGAAMFDAWFVGVMGVAGAVGAMLSPIFFGALADSWFRSERIMAATNLACAAMLVLLWNCQSQWWFFAATVGYYQFCVPSITLAHSLALRHLKQQRQAFPVVRVLGTVGWIVACAMVGSLIPWWWQVPSQELAATTWPVVFAAIAHVGMAAYALTLPCTAPLGQATSWRRLLDGCHQLLVTRPRLVRFLIVSFAATISAQFYNMFANLYLDQIGIEQVATKLSLGQTVEIGCMLILPLLMLRWGPKRVFVLGLVAWLVRFVCLSYGGVEGWPALLVYLAILLHGVCYTFVYITGYIYVDHAATPATQSAAQGLLAMTTSGLGHLTGSLLSGWMQARYLTPAGVDPAPYDWHSFFLVASAISLVALVLFWLLMGFDREVMPDEMETAEAV